MRPLANVLHDAWALLPEPVHEARLMTRAGLPTKTTREGILSALVPVPRSVVVGGMRARIDDATAETLRDSIAAASDRLREYALWTIALDAQRDRKRVRAEDVAHLARRLESERYSDAPVPSLGADERRAVAIRHLAEAAEKDPDLTAGMLRLHLREPAVRERLEARLERVWRTRRRPLSSVDENGALYREFLRGGGFDRDEGTAGTPCVDADAAAAWAGLAARPGMYGDDDAVSFGLVRKRVERPELTGALVRDRSTDPREPGYPLDANVHRRILRTRQGGARALPVRLDADAAFRLAIDASAEPLGVPSDWARRVLAIGARASTLLSWHPDRDTTAHLLSRLAGGEATIARNWRLAVEDARRKGDRAHRPDAVAFYEAPGDYYLGRLWTAVFRRCLASGAAPSADEAWALVYGAFVSTRGHLAVVSGLADPDRSIDADLKAENGFDGPLSAAARSRSAVDDVLRTAIAVFGAPEVLSFWNSVAALGTASRSAVLERQWRQYVAEDDADGDDSRVPFAVAHAFIGSRGALPTHATENGDEDDDSADDLRRDRLGERSA